MILIVATIGSDPVETGFVRSLNRPDGNITGASVFAVQLPAGSGGFAAIQTVAPSLGVELTFAPLSLRLCRSE
jgi:hypothetical protein